MYKNRLNTSQLQVIAKILIIVLIVFSISILKPSQESSRDVKIKAATGNILSLSSLTCETEHYFFSCSLDIDPLQIYSKINQDISIGLLGVKLVKSIFVYQDDIIISSINADIIQSAASHKNYYTRLPNLNTATNFKIVFSGIAISTPLISEIVLGDDNVIKNLILSANTETRNIALLSLLVLLFCTPFVGVLFLKRTDQNSMIMIFIANFTCPLLHYYTLFDPEIPYKYSIIANIFTVIMLIFWSNYFIFEARKPKFSSISTFFNIFSFLYIVAWVTSYYFNYKINHLLAITVIVLCTFCFAIVWASSLKNNNFFVFVVVFLPFIFFFIGFFKDANLSGFQISSVGQRLYLASSLFLFITIVESFFTLISKDQESIEVLSNSLAEQKQQIMTQQENLYQMKRQDIIKEQKLRFSQDLHDGISGYLISIRSINELSGGGDISLFVAKALLDIRILMDTSTASDITLAKLVQTFNIRIRSHYEAFEKEINLSENGIPNNIILSSEHSYSLMKVMQELHTNALKYSGSSIIETYVDYGNRTADYFLYRVENHCDDCMGLNSMGHGLNNVSRRLHAMGGELNFSHKNQLFKVELKLFYDGHKLVGSPVIST